MIEIAEVIIPYLPWSIAQKGMVVMTPQPPHDIYHDVDILIFPWGPGDIVIEKEMFPNGVIVLNDCPRPSTNDPISTAQTRVNLTISHDNNERLQIILDCGWPSAEIVLWDTLNPVPE